MIVAYIGPETALPVSSALAVVAGTVMAFWPKVKQMALAVVPKALRKAPARSQPPAAEPSTSVPGARQGIDEDTQLPGEVSSLAVTATEGPTSLSCP